MNAIALILILLLIVGSGCVLAAVGQLWAISGGIEDPVGARRPRHPAPPAPSIVPGAFRSLIQSEATGWKRTGEWQHLAQRLNQLEAEFGGVGATPAPEEYSPEWLEQRIAQIEELAGPLPAPLRPTPIAVKSRLPWKKT